MSRISSVNRMITIRPGKSVSRLYHNVQNMSRMQAGFASLEAILTVVNLPQKNLLTILFTGGLTGYFIKKSIHYHNIKVDLWDRYQEIVERAQKIAKKK